MNSNNLFLSGTLSDHKCSRSSWNPSQLLFWAMLPACHTVREILTPHRDWLFPCMLCLVIICHWRCAVVKCYTSSKKISISCLLIDVLMHCKRLVIFWTARCNRQPDGRPYSITAKTVGKPRLNRLHAVEYSGQTVPDPWCFHTAADGTGEQPSRNRNTSRWILGTSSAKLFGGHRIAITLRGVKLWLTHSGCATIANRRFIRRPTRRDSEIVALRCHARR